jgi:hypothetical protein
MSRMSTPLLAALALAPLLAAAHHGWSAYDAQQALTLTTRLESVRYGNPHVEVTIKRDDRVWNVVLAPVTRMRTRGLPDDALQAGRTVTLVGYPRLDGTAELRAERITVDGRTVELR